MANRAAGIFLSADFGGVLASVAAAAVVVGVAAEGAMETPIVGFVCGLVVVAAAGSSFGGCPNANPPEAVKVGAADWPPGIILIFND